MRRLKGGAWVALLSSVSACKAPESLHLQPGLTPVDLASAIHVGDPAARRQLLRGFHNLEPGLWRWTMGRFAVTLKTPEGAKERGGRVLVRLVVPEGVLARVKPVQLSAAIGATKLGSESYGEPGEHQYAATVDKNLMRSDTVSIEFELERYLPAGLADARELGVVALSFALQAQ